MRPWLKATALAALLIALAAITTLAQETAELRVQVSERGGAVPGAIVLLNRADGETVARRVSGSEGIAVLTGIPAGTYTLSVTYTGFAPYTQEDLVLAAGEKKSVEVMLTLAQFSQTITITTANRREELLRTVAEPTTLIDEASLEDTGGRSAKEVLIEQAGSGVVVSPMGGTNSVSINGLGGGAVLILIDGRRYLGRNSTGELNLEDLDLSNIERIEIVKGAGSAMYGSDAMAGVINFITKKPSTFGMANSIDVSYGSYNDTRFSDTLTFRNEKFSGAFSAGYRGYDGYDLDEETLMTEGEPESKRYNVSGNMEYALHEKVRTKVYADYSYRDVTKYYLGGATMMSPVYNSLRELTRYSFSPEVDFNLTDSTSVNAVFNYGKYERLETYDYGTSFSVQDPWVETNNEIKLTGRQIWGIADMDQFLQFGYEFRNQKLERGSLDIPDSDSNEADRDINVLWAQNEFNLIENFKITAGFRYDDYSDFGSEWSPKITAMYAVNDKNRVRFSYGHGFRAPRFGELYIDLGYYFKGNPDLLPETSNNMTIGYAHTGALAQGSFDFFYNKIENGIAFDLSVFPYTYNNLDAYTASGINSSLALNLPHGFTPEVSYTFTKREDEDGDKILGYPEHTAFVKLLWFRPQWGMRVNLRGQLMDKIEYSSGEQRPSYQIWYLKGSKTVLTKDNYSIDVFAQVDNLFGKENVFTRDDTGAPIEGDLALWLAPRTFRIGITIDLDWIGAN